MSSIMRRAMLYLGLAPEEDYEEQAVDYDDDGPITVSRVAEPEHDAAAVAAMPRGVPTRAASQPEQPLEATGPGAVRTITREAAQASGARIVPAAEVTGASVRTIPVTHAKPHVVAPQSFNDAQTVADRFKSDQPVIMNLQDVDRELRRRLIDFASGLSYGLRGRMDRVAGGVYLLSPDNVEVSEDERRRLQERGLHS